MMEDELIKIWKSSPEQEQVKFDKSRFMLDVQASVDDFYKQMKMLFIREAMGSFIAIPMFLFYAFLMPHVLTKIGFALVALGATYILYITKKAKNSVPNQFAMSYLQYLQDTKAFLEESKKQRETVVIWYLMPIVLPIWLAMVGFYLDRPESLNTLLLTIGVSILASVGIHFMNLRSANKVVAPRLEKVNKLLKTMEE
ncbi:MAG: hypothetical protein HRT61_16525 [Ekhidna sp.]|nr:hypothetical protein [Ekhidna sp.]